MQGLVRRVLLQFPDSMLGVLHLVKCSLRNRLKLIELHRLLTSERAELQSSTAEVRRLVGRIGGAERDLEVLLVARACVNELLAEWLLLIHGSKREKESMIL